MLSRKVIGWWPLILLALLIGVALFFLHTPSYFLRSNQYIQLQNNPMPLVGKELMGDRFATTTLPILADRMPEFVGITKWWNTTDGQALTVEKLKGKVVLIDFWTYSCINCIRTQPVLRKWWEAYEKDGLVIVGVHTPEFAFEGDPENVSKAIERAGLKFPIALDPNYETWNAYDNRYWPAEYFFDRQGRLRRVHFGEGGYEESERVIRELLTDGGTVTHEPTGANATPKFEMIKTPETYFGYQRMKSFANANELKRNAEQTYHLKTPEANEWSIGGLWHIFPELAQGYKDAIFRMNVESNAMHLVLGSPRGQKRIIQILIDGMNPTDEQLTQDTQRQADGTVQLIVDRKDLYRVARFSHGGRHTIELRILDPGIEFYAATFGE